MNLVTDEDLERQLNAVTDQISALKLRQNALRREVRARRIEAAYGDQVARIREICARMTELVGIMAELSQSRYVRVRELDLAGFSNRAIAAGTALSSGRIHQILHQPDSTPATKVMRRAELSEEAAAAIFAEVISATTRLDDMDREIVELSSERNRLVRALKAAGLTDPRISEVTGMGRARLWRISNE